MSRNLYREQKFSPLVRKMQSLKAENICCRLMIETDGRSLDRVISIIESNKGKVQRKIHMMPLMVAELPLPGLGALAGSRHVIKIWDDVPVHVVLEQSFPEIRNTRVQELGYTGKGAVVALLDTGIYPHEDLITPYNRILAWNDLIHQKNAPYDDNGHGTHIAGIIAGNGITADGKYKGLAPDARLVGIKVLNQEGSGFTSDVISGIEWCLDNFSTLNTRVINLSFSTIIQGSPDADPLCRAAVIAWRKGVIVCKAAGDTRPCFTTINIGNPIRGEVLVGNLNEQQTLTNQELCPELKKRQRPSSVVKPDLVAPGMEITSLGTDGGYATLSGTSIATAFISGAAALILQKWPHYNPDQVKHLLLKKAGDLGLGVDLQGVGILDLEKIFNLGKRRNVLISRNSNQNPNNALMQMILNMMSQNPGLQQKASQFIVKGLLSLVNNFRE